MYPLVLRLLEEGVDPPVLPAKDETVRTTVLA